ncbi:hypothetical protein [Mycobacterium marinum]|uniref:hypothetical protein n=1 Tax=Mycobacterium marinum TaxID=1781 RepID=UPI00235A0731|nr:hypothetical protein [Mycobacterium marinum]MDC9005089.1 hypothetical protein [Mycobacterium marinum]
MGGARLGGGFVGECLTSFQLGGLKSGLLANLFGLLLPAVAPRPAGHDDQAAEHDYRCYYPDDDPNHAAVHEGSGASRWCCGRLYRVPRI